MTRYTRVRLVLRGPVHFGGRGVGMERSDVSLPADSLFSALCIMISEYRGEKVLLDLLAKFDKASTPELIPFRLTSLMPYASTIHFLPYLQFIEADDLRLRKKFKRIEWVSETVFHHLARANTPSDRITIQAGKVWLTQEEKDALRDFQDGDSLAQGGKEPLLWRGHLRPRVTVDRQSQASAVFGIGSTHFKQTPNAQAGLYTVIEWLGADAATRELIRQAFEWLGDAGIGGERSYGYGHFAPEFSDMTDWKIGAESGNYFATLSPYHPRITEKEVIGEGARYEIALRRGWLSLPGYQNLRRASVRMLADGSILCWPQKGEPLGDLVDVTPQRLRNETGMTIYRYGLAFPVRLADAALHLKESKHGS